MRPRPPGASMPAKKAPAKRAARKSAEPQEGFETRAIHAGQAPDAATNAVVTPIHLTTTYAQDGLGGHKGFEYSRSGNPTRQALETCIASLEENAYGGTVRYFNQIAQRFGVEATYVDASDPANVEKAWRRNTKMLLAETP